MEICLYINSLAQAKTGTGKTIAFLLPVLQRILSGPRLQRHRMGDPLDIRAIVISPTRELAQQIASEANVLIQYCEGLRIHTAVGGTGKAAGLKKIHNYGCHILIATPGRLYDLLTDPHSGIHGRNMEMLVLDEADNLLDQGFAEALMDIIKLLPPKEARQTLLFSATVPEKVQKMINVSLKKEHEVLKMVPKGEVLTHQKVEQRLITAAGFENLLPTLYEQMQREIIELKNAGGNPFKSIVFFPTAKGASLAAKTFLLLRDPTTSRNPFGSIPLIEIHSRLSQPQRERAAREFRQSRSAVLFSSDVVARGMDFPNVTHVFQVGSPRSLEQYVHRIGRTGRGDNSGLGYLILADVEKAHTLRELRKEIKFVDYSNRSDIALLDMSKSTELPPPASEALTRILEASQAVDDSIKKGSYLANLGYYGFLGDKAELVASLNRWTSLGWGWPRPPRISAVLVGRLGLRGVPGIEIGGDPPMSSFRRDYSVGRGSFSSREGGYTPREGREGGFTPREGREGGYSPREGRDSGYTPREGRDGGYTPREGRDGGYTPREGGYTPRGGRDGGYTPRGREGGYIPRGGRGRGGFVPRGDREGGFFPRGGRGGFGSRGGREGGYERGGRDGGFVPRGDREGGFGGFGSRGGRGGFGSRGGRGGGFAPRGGRDGGFAPRGEREGEFGEEDGSEQGTSRGTTGAEKRPWEQRGSTRRFD